MPFPSLPGPKRLCAHPVRTILSLENRLFENNQFGQSVAVMSDYFLVILTACLKVFVLSSPCGVARSVVLYFSREVAPLRLLCAQH